MKKIKIFRLTTVPLTLKLLLKNQLRFLSNNFEIVAISSPGEDLHEVKRREGINVIPLKINREIHIIQDIISLLKLLCLFYRKKPDIVHSNTPKSSLLSMLAARILYIKRRVYTVGGLRFEGEKGLSKLFLILFEKFTCSLASHVLCESIGVKKKLISIGVKANKLTILRPSNLNGVDTLHFDPSLFNNKDLKYNLGLNENEFIFLFIGRIVKDKGIFELIDAFLLFEGQYDDVKLIIIGPLEGSEKDIKMFKNIISSHKNILYIDFLNEVREYLSISNCLILPSYREGFPNVILEAGSMGKPVIMTAVNGHEEYLNSTNGLLVQIADTHDLYKKMIEMYSNIEKYSSHLIREQVIDKFACEKVHLTIDSFYRNLYKHGK